MKVLKNTPPAPSGRYLRGDFGGRVLEPLFFFCFTLFSVLLSNSFAAPSPSSSLILKSADQMDNVMQNGELLSILKGNVVFTYDDAVIRSLYAKWWRDKGIIIFSDSVTVHRTAQAMSANRMHYDRDKKTLIMRGAVRFSDTEKHLKIQGEQGTYYIDQRLFSLVDDPRFYRFDTTASGDTLTVVGRQLTYNDSLNIATAIDSALITRGRLVSRSRTARFLTKDNLALLRGNPVVTYDKNRLQGDSVDCLFTNDALQGVSVKGNSFGLYKEPSATDTAVTSVRGDSLYMSVSDSGNVDTIRVFRNVINNYFQQSDPGRIDAASGRQMTVEFDSVGGVQRAIIWGNARSVYFVDGSDGDGKNEASGDTIIVSFVDGKTSRLHMSGKVRGTYTPQAKMEEARQQSSQKGLP